MKSQKSIIEFRSCIGHKVGQIPRLARVFSVRIFKLKSVHETVDTCYGGDLMIRAFYSAASGMVAQSLKQDIIADNIANAQTPGFKRVRTADTSFARTLQQTVTVMKSEEAPNYPQSAAATSTVLTGSTSDTSQGPIRQTDNPLDLALDGPGMFEIITLNGPGQTRDGSFRTNAAGELCTTDGYPVRGKNGPIKIPKGNYQIGCDGSVLSNGQTIDQISIAGAQPGKTSVLQGSIEESNVNIVSEMVSMITNMRSFEANQRVISSVDHTLDKLINEGGKV